MEKKVRSLKEQIAIETKKFTDQMSAIIERCSAAGIIQIDEEVFEFVDFMEPGKDTPTGNRLFPGAHEGNIRRLIRYALTASEWADISTSTRLWIVAAVLIDLGLLENNQRGINVLGVYAELVLGIEINYDHRRVHKYWRQNYPRTWNPHKLIGEKPLNADRVFDYARFVKAATQKDGHIDSRLWKAHN